MPRTPRSNDARGVCVCEFFNVCVCMGESWRHRLESMEVASVTSLIDLHMNLIKVDLQAVETIHIWDIEVRTSVKTHSSLILNNFSRKYNFLPGTHKIQNMNMN